MGYFQWYQANFYQFHLTFVWAQQMFWEHIWKLILDKKKLYNMTLQCIVRQAILGHIWKSTVEKNLPASESQVRLKILKSTSKSQAYL